jgi:hypothetical protein
MKRFLGLTAAILVVTLAVAGPPPALPKHLLDAAASLKKPAATALMLGDLRVSLEKTTLSDVVRAAPSASIVASGAGGERIFWVCFTDLEPHGASRLWVISSAEMGGPTQEITEVAALQLELPTATPDCPTLPKAFKPVSLDRGFWLGSSHHDLGRDMGASHNIGGWEAHRYSVKVAGSCDGGFDVTNWIATKAEGGHLVAIYAGQTTSC